MMQRNLSLDFLKIVLSFFVVGLHCSFLIDVNTDAYFATVRGIFRLAVPIFLIISGYYFLRNKRTIALIAIILSLYCIGFTIQTLGNLHFLPSKLEINYLI